MDRETMKAMAEAQFAERAAVVELHHLEGDNLSIDGHPYQLITNYREAFDDTKLKARFSTILTKYNYIVGDISADQLRLKGFYDAARPNTPRAQTIDALEDYLYEYVNFGAPYFVLFNPEPFTSKDDRIEDRPARPARQRVTNRPNRDKKPGQAERTKRPTRKPENGAKRSNSGKPTETAKSTKPRTTEQNKRPKSRSNGGNHEHREAKPANGTTAKPQQRAQRPRPTDKNVEGRPQTGQSRNAKNGSRNTNTKAKRPEVNERRKPANGDNFKNRDNQTAVSNNKPNHRKRSFTIRQKED